MTVTTTTAMGYWQSSPLTITPLSDREVWTETYEGDWDSLIYEFGQTTIGDAYTDYDNPSETIGPTDLYQEAVIVTNIQFSRGKGGLGICRLTYCILYKRAIWNIDFAEISKDIKVWLVAKYTDADGNVADEAYEELQKIARWQRQKDAEAWRPWKDFLYDGVTKLSGNTLKLAQKMMKGVMNYPLYVPVITRTTINAFSPEVGQIGKQYKQIPEGDWTGFDRFGLNPHWQDLAKVFLKTAERSTSNGDGTFTMVEQWQGADELDADLYPEAT